MVFYTSVTNCYIPRARLLGETLKKHNPDAKFYLILSDILPEKFGLATEPFDDVVYSHDISISEDMSLPYWMYTHDVTELCTAVKGWAGLEVLRRSGEKKLVYLDPDIVVFNSFEPLEKLLDAHDIVVTPHRLAPEERFDEKYYGDQQFYMRGIFNLGFVAVNATDEGISFLKWWEKMLGKYCYIDDPTGLFTDQKLIDLAPAFFPHLHICRDEFYNVSWWNISQREIGGTTEKPLVNGKPLVFYHFSNVSSGLHKSVIEDFCNDNKALWKLYHWYLDVLDKYGEKEYGKLPCVYDYYDNGQKITQEERYRARKYSHLLELYRFTDPFVTGDGTLYSEQCYLTNKEKTELNKAEELQQAANLADKRENEANRKLIEMSASAQTYQYMYESVRLSRSYRMGQYISKGLQVLFPYNTLRRRIAKKIAKGCWRALKKAYHLPMLSNKVSTKIQKITVPSFEEVKWSFVVANVSDLALMTRCIESIVSSCSEQLYEVIIATEKEPAFIKKIEKLFIGAKMLAQTNIFGLLQHCKGKYAIVIDEHASLEEMDYAKLAAYFSETPEAALLQPQVCTKDGLLLECGGMLLQNGQRHPYGFCQGGWFGKYRYVKPIDCTLPIDYVLDLAAFNEIKAVEDKWEPIYQIADIAFVLRGKGKSTLYAPMFKIVDQRPISELAPCTGTQKGAEAFSAKWEKVLANENIKSLDSEFLARDRSINRTTIFCVDDRTPCYDMSAGDRTTFHYIILLAQMGYNIKFVSNEMMRREPYASEMEYHGIEIVSADGGGDAEWQEFIIKNGRFINYAYINRPYNLHKFYPALKKQTNAKIVYNCMDLHFLRMKREFELANDQVKLNEIESIARQEIAEMDKTDIAFTVSTYEYELLKDRLQHATLVLNPIFIYDSFPNIDLDFSNRKGLIFVGGFAHTPNEDALVWFANEVFPKILKRIPDVQLHVVGSNPTKQINDLASDSIIIHGFMSDQELGKLYAQSRISIVPLRYGAGVKGKVIEAMYNGMPIVSTSIGTEGIVDIENYIDATDTAQEFAQRIVDIYPDTEALAECAQKNQTYTKTHLSKQAAETFFKDVFN